MTLSDVYVFCLFLAVYALIALALVKAPASSQTAPSLSDDVYDPSAQNGLGNSGHLLHTTLSGPAYKGLDRRRPQVIDYEQRRKELAIAATLGRGKPVQ